MQKKTALSSHYIDYVIDLLSQCGNIRARKMFSGYGFYKNGIFFALFSDDVLYFKVDDHNQAEYEAYGSRAFSYENKSKKTITLRYWQVPIDILEDHNNLAVWVDRAVQAAQRAKARN